MIVSEKDSTWKKIKWYIVCFVGSIIILVLLGGVLPFLVIKYYSTIVGGILFLPCFWAAAKLCFILENYIGVGCSLQNPNRRNLVRVFPDEWSLPWMRPAETEKKKQNSGKKYSTGGKQMSENNTIMKSGKLAKWHQEHPKRFFITVGTVLWVLFFAAAMWSFEFNHKTAYWHDLIYIPRGSFNPWLFLGLPFLIGIGMGLSALLYLLKFICWKLAWAVLLFTVSILSGWAIWENLPQNRFIYALGNAYHKGMRLESLKTFHSFNNSDELIAGKFYSSKEMICDSQLKVSPNRAVILKKVGDNIYEFESRFASGRRQGGNFEKIEKWTVGK